MVVTKMTRQKRVLTSIFECNYNSNGKYVPINIKNENSNKKEEMINMHNLASIPIGKWK